MKQTYQKLLQEKKRFVLFASCFAFIFYFMLPMMLTFFPEEMNESSFISGLSWAWIYAFSQIIMIWILGYLYHQKAKKIEKLTKQMMREE